MPIVPPIILVDRREIRIVRSRAEAEERVEARDVAGGVYRAWDAHGRRLRFDLGDAVCLELAPVTLSIDGEVFDSDEALRDVLVDLLRSTSIPFAATMSTSDLLRLAISHVGYEG